MRLGSMIHLLAMLHYLQSVHELHLYSHEHVCRFLTIFFLYINDDIINNKCVVNVIP